ncbi:hypothetical protein NOR53_2614 [gamma proteobacterium NOR5-3]|nr:hypothetical protein NOR53_2614 [gamma proteobacterium NOR5-3]
MPAAQNFMWSKGTLNTQFSRGTAVYEITCFLSRQIIHKLSAA